MSYETDYFAWTRQQAEHLRRLAELRLNLPVTVDLDRLAEEMEDLGDNTLDVVEGLLTQVLVHLLKLEWSPEEWPRRHWREEVAAFRGRLARRLKRSPSVARHIDFAALYNDARRQGMEALPRPIAMQVPAEDCPYTLEQALDPGFWPASRYGLEP